MMSGYLSVGFGKRRVFPSRPLASSCDFFVPIHHLSMSGRGSFFSFLIKIKIPSEVVGRRLVWSSDKYQIPVEIANDEQFFLGSPQSANFYGSLVFNPCLP
jgi:hypothetical protein